MKTIKLPIQGPLYTEALLEASHALVADTRNGIPIIYVFLKADELPITLKPDLMTWAQRQRDDKRSTLHHELDRRSMLNLSELGEERLKTVMSLAWDDIKRAMEDLCQP